MCSIRKQLSLIPPLSAALPPVLTHSMRVYTLHIRV